MEEGSVAEVENPASGEEAAQLSRNRSFKSKLLVRSQAICESQSPPRAVSPSHHADVKGSPTPSNGDEKRTLDVEWSEDIRKSASDGCVASQKERTEPMQQQVEIQITSGSWDGERCGEGAVGGQRRRRLARSDAQPELLSNNPRVTCVCGGCRGYDSRRARLCVDCRGRRRYGGACPAKQDSGIGCSQECPDCLDSPEIHVSPARDPAEQRRHRPRHKSESHDEPDVCRCQDRKERIPKIGSLNRTDSDERKEMSPEQLAWFIRETLNKDERDRSVLLRIEKELVALVNDVGRCVLRFPSASSYSRMLVHRCAELFQLRHTADTLNKHTVLVSKTGTSGGRIPCTRFREWCTAVLSPTPQRQSDATQAKSILKRAAHSLDEALGGGAAGGGASARSKSFEQREEEYERVRRRIFSSVDDQADGHSDGQADEAQWSWMSAGPVKLLTPDNAGKHNRLLKVQSLESQAGPVGGGSGGGAARGAVSKSHSFGGYGREEQRPRILSRQGDLASSSWRLSPSSSGYKTLSLRSTDSVTPSPTGGVSPEPCGAPLVEGGGVMWVLTDPASIPPGAVIIHPQTGRPYTNPDGSVYQYDPSRPLPNTTTSHVVPALEEQTDQNVEKKRGRLEKQNSFIDPECECKSEGYPSENCCTCCDAKSRVDWSHQCYHSNQDISRPKSQEHCAQNQQRENACNTAECQEPPDSSKYEPANHGCPPTNQTQEPIQTPRPANQGVEQASRAIALDETADQELKEDKRTEDDSYRYGADYGPNVNNDMVHYTVPYYQAMNHDFSVNAETQVQPQSVTSPVFIPESQLQHTGVKALPANYDQALRPQLSLGGLSYPTGVTQNGYQYTNHCRTGSIPEQQLHSQHVYAVLPEHKSQPEHPEHYQEGYYQQAMVQESTPGYQGYGLVGYGHQVGCGGACGVDPTTGTFHCTVQAQRGLSVTYAQHLEQQQMMQSLPAAYSAPNVMLPQSAAPPPPVNPYQYATPNQWQPAWQPTLIAAQSQMPPTCATPVQKPPTPPNLYMPPELPIAYAPYKPEYMPTYPMMHYPNYAYHQYNIVPQLIPNTYQVLHPVMLDRSDYARRNSGVRSYESVQSAMKLNMARARAGSSVSNSSRTTPLHRYTPPVLEEVKPIAQFQQYSSMANEAPKDAKEHYSPSRRLPKQGSLEGFDRRRPFRRDLVRRESVNSTELATKIQQIKEQMSQMNVQSSDRAQYDGRGLPRMKSFPPPPPEGEAPRQRLNSSGSLLGEYPTTGDPHAMSGIPVAHENAQLSSTARAIVNSIRSIQSRVNNTAYQHDNPRRRYDYQPNYPQRAPVNHYRHDRASYDGHRNYHRPDYRTQNQYDKTEIQTAEPNIVIPTEVSLSTAKAQERVQVLPEPNTPDIADIRQEKNENPPKHDQDQSLPDRTQSNQTTQDKDQTLSELKTPDVKQTSPDQKPNAPERQHLLERNTLSDPRSTPNFTDRRQNLANGNQMLAEQEQSAMRNLPERPHSVPDSIQNIRREIEGRRREQRSQDLRVEGQFIRNRNPNPVLHYQYGRPYVFRQMTAGASGFCRRSPGPPAPAPGFNPRYGPRRPAPDTRRR